MALLKLMIRAHNAFKACEKLSSFPYFPSLDHLSFFFFAIFYGDMDFFVLSISFPSIIPYASCIPLPLREGDICFATSHIFPF
jgi:hypothetical protein